MLLHRSDPRSPNLKLTITRCVKARRRNSKEYNQRRMRYRRHLLLRLRLQRIQCPKRRGNVVRGGSDLAADRWRDDYRIGGCEDLDLHHLYRAMAWLGEALPA